MFDAFFLCYLLRFLKGMDGSRRNVLHSIAWEEAAEVQGMVGKAVVSYPTAHFANHLHVVVDVGDDKVGEFYPHPGITHGEDGVEDGLQMTAADALIDVVAE